MKFEYGDLYKFTVSLGVILISFAVLAPWLFLKESFDLFKPLTEIDKLPEFAQRIINTKQILILHINKLLPYLSLLSLIVGCALIWWGLSNWKKNQNHLDEQTEIAVKLARQSLANENNEDHAVDSSSTANLDQMHICSSRRHSEAYYRIEEKVVSRLSKLAGDAYTIVREQLVGNFSIDIILKHRSSSKKNFLVEVKYIRKGFNFGWLREVFLKVLYAKSIYGQMMKSAPNSLLLIVIDADKIEDKYSRLLNRINQDANKKDNDFIKIITKKDLLEANDSKFRELLSVPPLSS